MASDILSCCRDIAAPLADVGNSPLDANRGLIFDRYLALWKKQKQQWKKNDDIFKDLDNFARSFDKHLGSLAKEVHQTQEKILETAGKGSGKDQEQVFAVACRLACGLGYDHPTENGFVLDHLRGLPYIPASGIKGLCRVMAGYYAKKDRAGGDWNDDVRMELFGSLDTEDGTPDIPLQRGDIVFLDAYPETHAKVEVDVSTVHHQKYYHSRLYTSGRDPFETDTSDRKKGAGKGKDQGKNEISRPDNGSPMENEDPIPIFFLTIGEGTRFVFRFFSRTGNKENIDKIKKALTDGLTLFGIGAKTAAGFGRFVQDDSVSKNSSGAAPLSEAARWVQSKLNELCAKHNVPDPRQILRGKVLAEEWKKLADPQFKAEVETEIRKQWAQQGLTISKKVKQLYEEGAS